MPKLKLFNTISREKEQIQPINSHELTMYTCGPTVYNYAHIGNFRTYVFEDILRRTLKYFGFKVHQVMNITDLDDKTIKGAIEKKITLKEFTDPFKDAFFEDLQTLSIEKVEHYPAATEYISQMIEMIQVLIDKGYAYQSPSGSVYFKIAKFSSYGRLSHLNLEELQVNASGDNIADEYEKDHLSDFVLWKIYDPERDGNIFWESPWGKGRPGWHIECSAMSTNLLGPSIDIHCGGVDNMFPHHENEIAQSECCSGHKFVNTWIHVEHLLVDHKKMSKSLGNFFTLRDLLNKGYSGEEVRYLLLSTHYRTQLNFTFQGLDAARNSIRRLFDLVQRLKDISIQRPHLDIFARYELRFKEALADDINISVALSVLFDLVREVNTFADQEKLGKEDATKALELLKKFNTVLAIIPLDTKTDDISQELVEMLNRREQARKNKDWKTSDEMRDKIYAQGYVIEDTPNGARLKKK